MWEAIQVRLSILLLDYGGYGEEGEIDYMRDNEHNSDEEASMDVPLKSTNATG